MFGQGLNGNKNMYFLYKLSQSNSQCNNVTQCPKDKNFKQSFCRKIKTANFCRNILLSLFCNGKIVITIIFIGTLEANVHMITKSPVAIQNMVFSDMCYSLM